MTSIRLFKSDKLHILTRVLIDIKAKFDSTPFGEEVSETEKQIYDYIKNNIDILIPPDDMIILKKYVQMEPVEIELSTDYAGITKKFYGTFHSKTALNLHKYGKDIAVPRNLVSELINLLNKNIPQDTLNEWYIILDRYMCEVHTIQDAYKNILDKIRTVKQLSKYPELQKHYNPKEEVIDESMQEKSAQEIIKLFNQE